jgi:predicted DNA-binding transcriptional regulator AlpA
MSERRQQEALMEHRRLTVREAADYTGLAAATLNKLRVRGDGPLYIRPGGSRRVVYDTADLDAWLQASRRKSTSEIIAA